MVRPTAIKIAHGPVMSEIPDQPTERMQSERKGGTDPGSPRLLSPAAQRALAEAAARRAEIDRRTQTAPPEKGGRGGLDPVRYGDWEIKGLAADF